MWEKARKDLPYGQVVDRLQEAFELARQDRSGRGIGFEAHKWYFIAKTQEFLEHLGSYEFPGRDEYASQIGRDLQALRRLQTKQELERIVNDICLKVAIACYALEAHERASRRAKPDSRDR